MRTKSMLSSQMHSVDWKSEYSIWVYQYNIACARPHAAGGQLSSNNHIVIDVPLYNHIIIMIIIVL